MVRKDQSSGEANSSGEPRFLVIGQVLRPQGVRGELRVRLMTNYPEHFLQLDRVGMGHDDQAMTDITLREVERVRLHQAYGILKLADVDDRDDADLLREQFVMVPLDDAVPLDEDEYYHFQLIGLTMVTDADEILGDVTDILETGANDVYVVNGPRYGEILVPAIASVVQEIDLDARRIIITPLPGLLPDAS
jgi:16S rRNA processing protein RimM